jgi:hypothetical protein
MNDAGGALDLEQFLNLLDSRIEEKAREDGMVVTREEATWHSGGAAVRIERLPQANATGDLRFVRSTPSGYGAGDPVSFWCERSSVEPVANWIMNFFNWLAGPKKPR